MHLMRCRYEFFAPIWRVMRDDNMPVAEVARQVKAVALAVKQGSSISDMRHHTLTGRIRGAQVRHVWRVSVCSTCFSDIILLLVVL
jgi:hypothetical protein